MLQLKLSDEQFHSISLDKHRRKHRHDNSGFTGLAKEKGKKEKDGASCHGNDFGKSRTIIGSRSLLRNTSACVRTHVHAGLDNIGGSQFLLRYGRNNICDIFLVVVVASLPNLLLRKRS